MFRLMGDCFKETVLLDRVVKVIKINVSLIRVFNVLIRSANKAY